MADKKYLNGIIIKEKEFDNGGKQLQIKIKVSEFIDELRSVEENDWANLIINRRKQPSDKGVTHYMVVDTWRPDKNYQAPIEKYENESKPNPPNNSNEGVGDIISSENIGEEGGTEDRLPF